MLAGLRSTRSASRTNGATSPDSCPLLRGHRTDQVQQRRGRLRQGLLDGAARLPVITGEARQGPGPSTVNPYGLS